MEDSCIGWGKEREYPNHDQTGFCEGRRTEQESKETEVFFGF